MKRMLGLSIGLVLASFGVATVSSAQSNTTSPEVAKRRPPTHATPEVINEAIQRSQARAARQRQTDKDNQQSGSEEPFRYKPNQR